VISNFFKKQLQHLVLGLMSVCVIQSFVFAYTPLDRIVAIVNEDVIMKSELDNQLRISSSQLKQRGVEPPPLSVLKRQVLNNLILTRIQLQLAAVVGIKVSETNLNRTISNIAAESRVTLDEFKEILKKDGYNYKKFRENIRNEITLTQLRKRQIENRINITEKEIDNFLSNENSQNLFESEIRLSHILFSLPDTATNEEVNQTKEMAIKVRDELLAGGDFKKIAATVSDGGNAKLGGDLGWRKEKDIPSIFSKYIPNMKLNDISELIRSPSGFHIIKISEIKDMKKNMVKQTLARHILIKTNEYTTNEDAEKKLNQLRMRIMSGDDFALLAKGNSDDAMSAIDGGELGWTTAGQLVVEFQNVLDELKSNEISKPFKTQYGWHIAQVLERRNHDNSENLKRTKVRNIIGDRKLNEALQNWKTQLLDEAYVEYRLDDI